MGIATHVNEQGISDEELSDMDPQEGYTAVNSVFLTPRQAAEEGKENPKLAELKPLKPIRGFLEELRTITLRMAEHVVRPRSS